MIFAPYNVQTHLRLRICFVANLRLVILFCLTFQRIHLQSIFGPRAHIILFTDAHIETLNPIQTDRQCQRRRFGMSPEAIFKCQC